LTDEKICEMKPVVASVQTLMRPAAKSASYVHVSPLRQKLPAGHNKSYRQKKLTTRVTGGSRPISSSYGGVIKPN
jgi:hypothetical protein